MSFGRGGAAAEIYTGYSRDELVGRNPRILKSGEHDREFYATLWQATTNGETSAAVR